MVVPKDQSDVYYITRKVVLTDTEGEAHGEANGGDRQKEDTASEEDSEDASALEPEVKVVSGAEDVTLEAVRQLEEKIESGNVMVFSGATNYFSARSSLTLEKGADI